MKRVEIYMEGGGRGKERRAALRQGMDGFLKVAKSAATARSFGWKLVCCGSRNDALRHFRSAVLNGDADPVILLVDAEGPVTGLPRDHLRRRDKWDLDFAGDDVIHLMVQTMEAWIVADPDRLASYYGQGFRRSALPRTANLEAVPKRRIEKALESATRDTQKGEYHKIWHARDLLQRIDPIEVKRRCAGCRRLFEVLESLLAA